jgi:hypothetical protein
MIQLRTRSLANITTSLNRLHPVACAVSTGPSDSGLFAVSERPARLSSQFATIIAAALLAEEWRHAGGVPETRATEQVSA